MEKAAKKEPKAKMVLAMTIRAVIQVTALPARTGARQAPVPVAARHNTNSVENRSASKKPPRSGDCAILGGDQIGCIFIGKGDVFRSELINLAATGKEGKKEPL